MNHCRRIFGPFKVPLILGNPHTARCGGHVEKSQTGASGFTIKIHALLGGPWDSLSNYNWTYNNPTFNVPKLAYRGCPNYK